MVVHKSTTDQHNQRPPHYNHQRIRLRHSHPPRLLQSRLRLSLSSHASEDQIKYFCNKADNSLSLSRRGFHVEPGTREKAQRSATKVTFPLVWTNTCCSHPLYRESEHIPENALGVRNAAQRKLLDELGIPAEDVPVDQFTPLGRRLYKALSDGKWGEHELEYLLFIVRDVNVNPNPDEVADIKYVNKEELKELLRKADAGEGGIKLSPWFRLVVDNFLFKWWDHVEKGTLSEAADMKTIHKLT